MNIVQSCIRAFPRVGKYKKYSISEVELEQCLDILMMRQ